MATNMMGTSSSNSRQALVFLLVAIVIVVVGALLWYFKFRGVSTLTVVEEKPQSARVSGAPELDEKAKEILEAIQILKNTELDTRFLEDARFTTLRETRFMIPPAEPSGRYPFRLNTPSAPKKK